MKALILVFLGGGLGSVLRYSVYRLFQLNNNNSVLATFSVNIIGSLFLGIILGYALKEGRISDNWVLFLATGLCGGFTTFSTFAFENNTLLSSGEYSSFFLYALGSLALGILAILLGLFFSRVF